MPEIKFDKDLCIGCGVCESVCGNWVIDYNEGKAKPKKTSISGNEVAENKNAEDVCPVNAIKIVG